MPLKVAPIAYMTKVGDGYIIAAPGRASAVMRIWISSSEPLPRRTSMPAGTFMRREMASRSLRGLGVG